MTKHTRSSEFNATAAITWGVVIASLLVLGTAWGAGTGELEPIEPIRVAPSATEVALWVRNDTPSLVAVLPLMLQDR
jgi:hypothetical protein